MTQLLSRERLRLATRRRPLRTALTTGAAALAAAALVVGAALGSTAGRPDDGPTDSPGSAAASADSPASPLAAPADRLSPPTPAVPPQEALAEPHGTAAILAAVPRAGTGTPGSGGGSGGAASSTAESEVLRLTNAQRAAAGCGPLTLSGPLTSAARAHSLDMGQQGYFSHTSADGRGVGDRVTAAGYRWSGVAENISAGQTTAQQVVDGWMASAGHRANILDCAYTELGVGAATVPGSPYGSYWTQVFGTPA